MKMFIYILIRVLPCGLSTMPSSPKQTGQTSRTWIGAWSSPIPWKSEDSGWDSTRSTTSPVSFCQHQIKIIPFTTLLCHFKALNLYLQSLHCSHRSVWIIYQLFQNSRFHTWFLVRFIHHILLVCCEIRSENLSFDCKSRKIKTGPYCQFFSISC